MSEMHEIAEMFQFDLIFACPGNIDNYGKRMIYPRIGRSVIGDYIPYVLYPFYVKCNMQFVDDVILDWLQTN